MVRLRHIFFLVSWAGANFLELIDDRYTARKFQFVLCACVLRVGGLRLIGISRGWLVMVHSFLEDIFLFDCGKCCR